MQSYDANAGVSKQSNTKRNKLKGVLLPKEVDLLSLLENANRLGVPLNLHIDRSVKIIGNGNAINYQSEKAQNFIGESEAKDSAQQHPQSVAKEIEPTGAVINQDEFTTQLRALCDAYEVREFAIYGRFAQVINEQGLLCPPDRLVWLDGEPMVAEEAAYHFGRVAVGKAP